MDRLKGKLASEFDMKEPGSLRYFLSLEVTRNGTCISVSQRKYVMDLLKETGMLGCTPFDTPIDPSSKLSEVTSGSPVDKGRYQRLDGKLIYLAHARPDIALRP